jgi:4-hydroxy-2-oxoheptanedioate aldolase
MLIHRKNKLRQKLAQGQRVIGTGIQSSSPNIVEAAAYSGIDFIRIDIEHNWRQDDSLDHMIRAAHVAGVTPIVRLDRDNPLLIRKALEVGADGIIITHVSDAAYAREVVRAAKFPPHGNRGFSTLCLAGAWGAAPMLKYIDWSNTEPLIGVMIESAAAVEAVEEIMAVEGLDFVLLGPADMSLSYGLTPDFSHEVVQKAMERTIAAARANGKHVMLGVPTDDAEIDFYINKGIDMVEIAHDVQIVYNLLASKVANFRRD